MKTKTEQPYKFGDLIVITKRKCSDKIQPKIKVGTHYFVLEAGKLKNGATVLSVAEFSAIAYGGLMTPNAKIDPKLAMQCNEERFEWKRRSQTELMAEFQKFKEELDRKQEEKEKEFLEKRFTEKERIKMAYHPYIYAELAWVFALRALSIVKDRKISSFRGTSHKLEEFRRDFMLLLSKKMEHPVVMASQERVAQLLEDNYRDFLIFHATITNEINRQHVGIPNDDIKAYAYMSLLCYQCLQRLDDSNVELIRKKLGFATRHDSYPLMAELKQCMLEYMEGCQIEHTLNIRTAVSVLEKNVMNLKL